MDEQQKQTIFDLPKVIAVGIASPVATLLTSRFGIAGTLIGLAVGAVVITVIVDVLKVYLARVPGAVTTIPGGFRKRSSLRNILERIRLPLSKFSSLAPRRRRSILIGSIAAAGISFLVGLSAVTALEVGVGKSLSCWVWNECATESSTEGATDGATDGGSASTTSTLPSVLGGGQSVSIGDTLEVRPLDPQQQPTPPSAGAPESSGATKSPSSSQPPSSETPQGLDNSGAGDQREDQYPTREGKDQESPSYYYSSEEGDQESPSYYYYYSEEEEYQQPEEENQQQSTPSPTDEAARLDTESGEGQSNGADSIEHSLGLPQPQGRHRVRD